MDTICSQSWMNPCLRLMYHVYARPVKDFENSLRYRFASWWRNVWNPETKNMITCVASKAIELLKLWNWIPRRVRLSNYLSRIWRLEIQAVAKEAFSFSRLSMDFTSALVVNTLGSSAKLARLWADERLSTVAVWPPGSFFEERLNSWWNWRWSLIHLVASKLLKSLLNGH